MPNSNKILCAISGGVDSSVAASILKQKGYDVIGIFMNFWSENEGNSSNKCCSIESYGFARTIANKLNIKLYSLNFKELFRKKVVEYFIQGYEKGITPNPCIVCNREIKFGKLLKIAHNLGATKIATGHYARIIKKGDKFELHRGIDKNKDQSYFLWRIPASSLSSIIFPLGKLTKNAVRKIAKKHQLITFNKKDSQGLCFVGKSNSHFLSKYAKKLLEPGDVVDKNNNIIGTHKGLSFYTIGQRAPEKN
ncbi:MAG: tRNA 2-thiouridine(34) synthase MnmA [Candidatus Berkelbacteria bacterium]|nr:tRNA 2-thiouridine(34) synthase MnmA [Candidatus Berkelbacteria bacterium]